MATRPKFWPWPQRFGLASASNIWPQPGLDLVVLLCNRAFFGQKLCKIPEFVNFSGNNHKSYVINHYLVLFHNYFWPLPWSQPPEIGLGLGLGLDVLGLFNITKVTGRLCTVVLWAAV